MSAIKKIEDFFLQLISSSKNLDELEDIRIRALGKKGEVSNLMKSIGSMNEKERRMAQRPNAGVVRGAGGDEETK